MAEAIQYDCDKCGFSISAWSDGNPYYIDVRGVKQYAYHPDHEKLALCIGIDTEHLCLSCGKEFRIDSREPIDMCPKCGSRDIFPSFQIEGKSCPYCKVGKFKRDPDFYCIS